jgi:hypothetical protein
MSEMTACAMCCQPVPCKLTVSCKVAGVPARICMTCDHIAHRFLPPR